MIIVYTPYLYSLRWFVHKASGSSAVERDMVLWREMIDWLGDYPFGVSTPAQIFKRHRDRGLVLFAPITERVKSEGLQAVKEPEVT